MKKIISLILMSIFLSSTVLAEQRYTLQSNTGDNLLYNVDLSVEISKNSFTIPDFSNFVRLEKISVPSENPYFAAKDGVLYTKDMSTLICYPAAKPDSVFSVPESVTTIRSNAFSQNPYLQRIILSPALRHIGANPFAKCPRLSEIKISAANPNFSVINDMLYDKKANILYSCPASKSTAVLPDSVRQIAYAAFAGCTKLRDIMLPQGLKKIDSMAFNRCSSLISLVIPPEVEAINVSAFYGCASLVELKTVNSRYFKTVDGILYSADMIDLMICPDGKPDVVTIPDGVQNILNGAFDNCTKLTRLILPDSLTYIARAFLNCSSLKSIEMPKNQAIVEYGTFAGCVSLEWIYLPNNIVIIQDGVFKGCTPTILCDEDSFSEMYAIENQFPFGYKYNLWINGKYVPLSNQLLEKGGKLYLPISELSEILGGHPTPDNLGKLRIDLSSMTLLLSMANAEKIVRNQSEMIALSKNLEVKNNTLYILADDFAKIFGMKVNQSSYRLEIETH